MNQTFCGYRYSRILAKQYGERAALLLQTFSFLAQRYTGKIVHDNKSWFFITLDRLAIIYEGVISRSAIHRQLQKLIQEGVILKKQVMYLNSLIDCYSFNDNVIQKEALAEDNPIFFEPKKAKELGGILPAVIYQRFTFWLKEGQKSNPELEYLKMTGKLAEVIGSNRVNVYRALKRLQLKGVFKAQLTGKQTKKYALVKKEAEVVEIKQVTTQSMNDLKTVAFRDKTVAFWDKTVAKWDAYEIVELRQS